jgi:phage pi2 protein 07
MVKIYESPDGGLTVYERDTVTGKRICIEKPTFPEWHIDDNDWWEIKDLAEEGNKTLQNLLKEVKLVYNLSKEPEETYDE